MDDVRKEANDVWRDELNPVLLLIKYKCFKEGRTEKGQQKICKTGSQENEKSRTEDIVEKRKWKEVKNYILNNRRTDATDA